MERAVEATAKVWAPVDDVRAVLREAPARVFGEPECEERRFVPHRFHTTIPARLRPDATVEEAVLLEIGPVPGEGRPLAVDVTWTPAGHQRVIPAFTGVLCLEPADGGGSELTVRGTYETPFGAVGRFGDAVLGSRVARTSLEETVERLAERIEAVTVDHRRSVPVSDLRPHEEPRSRRSLRRT